MQPASETAVASTAAPAPKRASRNARVVGALCTIAGFWLAVDFAKNPGGTLPLMPNAWRGGPQLMGAGFLAICGTFLLVQNRFSLAAFAVAALVSGAFATGAQAYVTSIRTNYLQTIHFDIELQDQAKFLDRA